MLLNPYRFGAGGVSDPSFASVQVLLHLNGTNGSTTIVDSSTPARAWAAVSTAALSTTQVKFGTTSLVSPLANAFVQTTTLTGLSPGTGDFTIECFLYPTDAAAFPVIARATGAHTGRFYFAVYPPTRRLYVQFNGADAHFSTTNAVTMNVWQHIEWSRASGTTYIFVDGVQVHSAADTNDYQAGTTAFNVGGGLGGDYTSYLDEFRMTVGVARHTSGFTPPSAAFPDS